MPEIDLHKLRAIQGVLDERTREAMRDCTQEAARWKGKNVERTLMAFAMCQIPKAFWYLKIGTIPYKHEVVDIIQKYEQHVAYAVLDKKLGLCITGPPGTGKTFYATFIAKHAVQKNIAVWFYDNQKFTDDVMRSMKDADTKRRLNNIIKNSELLIFDNLAYKWEGKTLSFMCNKLEQILEQRRGKGAVFFTMQSQLPEQSPRLISLIREFTQNIEIQGVPDMRKSMAKDGLKEILS